MTVLPLVVMTSLPSMVIFTGSINLIYYVGATCVVARPNGAGTQVRPYGFYGLLSHRAPLLCDVRFKFAAKLAYECARRPGSGITEGADRVARDVARDVENQIQVTLFALAIFDPMQNLLHPVAAFAAWAALAAGLVREESGKVQRGPHHAGAFVHDDHAARPEQTARGLHGFVVEVHFVNLVGKQHGHPTAAGNDPFEFLAARHAAAIFFKKFFERIAHLHFINAGFRDMAADAEQLGAFAFFRAQSRIRCRAPFEDPWQRREGLDVVHHGRTTE